MAAAAAAAPPSIEVTRLLLHAQDPDPAVRSQAEQQIAYFQEQNYAGFLGSLAYELANGEKPPESRRLAGIVLKNNLDAKDDARKAALVARWEGVDAGLRGSIRGALLRALAMEPQEVPGEGSQPEFGGRGASLGQWAGVGGQDNRLREGAQRGRKSQPGARAPTDPPAPLDAVWRRLCSPCGPLAALAPLRSAAPSRSLLPRSPPSTCRGATGASSSPRSWPT
jgi:hypothetical protein